MNITNARNPKFSSANTVNLEIEHPQYGWLPFTASPDDTEAHGRDLFARAIAGEFGSVVEYVAPVKSPEQIRVEAIRQIDTQRDAALSAGFTHNGQLFHCDPTFQSQIQAFLLAWQAGMLPADATVGIRRKDNVTVQLNQAEVAALAGALMAHVQGVYATSWAAKDAL